MREMKDGGVQWIGEIPEKWAIVSTKFLFTIISGATPESAKSENWDGNIRWITPADYKTKDVYVAVGRRNLTQMGFDSCSTNMVPTGSIIFSKRAPIGSVAITSADLCTNQGCLSCINKGTSFVKFYYYVMSIATEQYELLGSGTTFKEIIRKIDQLSANSIDVILIYIPEEYEVFTSYTDGTINYDLHDYIKAYAAQKQVATQFVREKTIESDLHCQIMWALSLALYVKSGRTPWVVNGIQPDTAFAGIGYSVMNGPSGSNVVVGCSHIYSSDGRGMKYKLSKIQDYSFDRKKNPYLSEEEAYRIGLNIKELFYKSFSELPKRVVIHKRTPFRREEVKGLVESLSSAGVKNIELLEITYEDNLKCFALNERCTQVDGYPVRRGMCFPIDKNTMYLFTHGIAPSVISPKRRYFQGGKSVPLPLKVVKHYGSGDMAQIATEILGLSKMNWNSFGLYSKLPCTIESSNEIARIGWLLSQFEGTLYDYRYFM